MADDLPDHTNYSVLKAEDAEGNLLTVLLDPSGAIVSVMQGWYAGEMKPLAVDDKGRIQAVLTDPEDVFGNPNYIGAGELAARLGSIRTFEKRGETVFMDDFEASTLKWETGGLGEETILRSNKTTKSGDFSLKLLTGAEPLDSAYIIHALPLPTSNRFGFEYSFALGSGIYSIYNMIRIYTADTRYTATVAYLPGSNSLILKAGGGVGEVELDDDLDLIENDFIFHTWKIVLDFETGKYVRIFCNHKEYDVSAYELETATAGPYTPYMYIYVPIFTDNGSVYVYVDDIILTQNEP